MENNKAEHKIYNYLKNNPSVALALSSAGIAFGTAIINLLVYIKEKQYLDYWQISSSNAYASQGQLYFICATLALSIISVFTISFIESGVKKYYFNVKELLFYQYLLKHLRKKEREYFLCRLGARIKLLRCRIINLFKKQYADSDLTEIDELLATSKKFSNENKDEIKDVKKELKKDKKYEKTKLLFKIMFSGMLICITQYIYFSLSRIVVEHLLVYSVIISAIEVAIYFILVFVIRKDKREIKKDAVLYLKNNKEIKEKYLNHEDYQKSIVDNLSDNSLKSLGLQAVYYFIVFLVIAIASTYYIAPEKKSFYIYEDEENKYALIYENADNYIFEKAEISDDVLVVDTGKQLFMPKENILLEYREFKDATRKDLNG